MICLNELSAMKCNNKQIFEIFVTLLAPFAPHISEELYHLLGHNTSVCDAPWPTFDEKFLKESLAKYAVSFNGKVRFTMELPADMDKDNVGETVLADEQTKKYMDGKEVKKLIVVPGKIVNIVL
jgi:leucyl-tRNA synthetase